MATKTNSNVRGNPAMCKGTMPPDKLSRFKLKGNIPNYERLVSRNTRAIAKSIRSLHTYRMLAHGCMESRLPASLRYTAHYFAIPLSRENSDNPRDRRDNPVSNNNNQNSPVASTTATSEK